TPVELWNALKGGAEGKDGFIFYYSRLPRTVAAVSAGFALALSGAILQKVLGNRLAAPGIIGVNSGSALAYTVALLFGAVSGWALSASSFLGALVSSVLVVLLSRKIRASRSTVLLAGVSLNYIFSAFTDIITTLFPKQVGMSGDFKVGGFSSLSFVRLYPAAAVIAVSGLIVFSLSNELEVLALGDDEAKSLGMDTGRMRMVFVVLSAALAGAAVSFSGLMGFVGLVVPNAVKKIVKGNNSFYLPITAVSGGILVVLCDTLSRVVFRPYEVPVGILLALIGGPVFLFMVLGGGK
ncbi:MAG: FecCD family ABC transporter permease, partial [Candidatus Ornithospirochaeta sp.]